jgi:hypothetical protein
MVFGFTLSYLLNVWDMVSNGLGLAISLALFWPIFWIIHIPYMLGVLVSIFVKWIND